MFKKAKGFIVRHKIASVVVVIAVVGGAVLLFRVFASGAVETKYVLTKAEKGTIVSSLSSSGQVLALNSLDVKAKASGDVVYVGVQAGDTVKAGKLIAKLDTTSAEKSIRDAEQNLQSAKITLQKLAGDGSLAVPRNKQDAQDQLAKDYESGFNSVANAFLDLPAIMADLNEILFSNTFSNSQQNLDYYSSAVSAFNANADVYKTNAGKSYTTARTSYDKNFNDYKTTTRFSDNTAIDSIIKETYNTTKDIAQAVKDANNLIQLYNDTLTTQNIKVNSSAETHLSTLSSDLGKVNSALSNLLNSQNTIKSDKDSLANSDLDVESQKLSLTKAQNSLADAKSALADYYVYAPFDGTISAVNVKVGNSASGAVASIITKTMVAQISFGETDIAKIKLGQKSTLVFDAIPDLSITGKVSAIDVVGTSSQGVVSYNVKVVMDVQDDRIKPGMSTTATIITDSKTDALYVPNSAVKTQQGSHYVLKVTDSVSDEDLQNSSGVTLKTAPVRQTVETGLADDSSTEILSGISEGDVIVVKTASSVTATKTPATQTGGNRNFGGGGGGGVRVPGL